MRDEYSLPPWLLGSLARTTLISAISQGTNVRLAQHIFSLLYLLNLALVFRIMVKTRKVGLLLIFFLQLLLFSTFHVFSGIQFSNSSLFLLHHLIPTSLFCPHNFTWSFPSSPSPPTFLISRCRRTPWS